MSWFDELKKNVVESLSSDIKQANITGLEGPLEKADTSEDVGRKAHLIDPFYENAGSSYYLQRGRLSRISNKTLKDVSVRDWLVSAILQNRVDTFLRFSRPTHNRFDMGYRFTRRDKKQVTEEDVKVIARLEKYIYNCGETTDVPSNDVMCFSELLKLVVRDALTFGYIGIEKILTRSGGLHRFRPIPAETLYLINPQMSKGSVETTLENAVKTYAMKRSDNDPRGDGVVAPRPIEYFKYVQVSGDSQPLAAFGDEDLIFKLANVQNFADSNGYCISAVEQAIVMISNHLNVEHYNSNYFTHGYAARGILHLKGTVTQNALAAFRRQFYNTISGTQNAWRTPIVAGLEDVQWVPMSGSAKEMEYINYNSHIMRALCTQFQIDPIELGLDFLTSANGRSSSSGKESGQFKITYSRERGLLPLFTLIEDVVNNDIIRAYDKELAETYCFKFVGFENETAQTDVALRQAQSTTFASMNYLLTVDNREKINHPIADLPLNQSFWTLVQSNMTRGEIREHFLGDKGASLRPELQYIPGDPSFLAWSGQLLAISAQKKQMEDQAKQQQAQADQANQQQQQAQQQQDHDKEMKAKQDSREQEAHDAEMSAKKDQKAQAVVDYTKSLHESGKQFGATGSIHTGGTIIKNPLNSEE